MINSHTLEHNKATVLTLKAILITNEHNNFLEPEYLESTSKNCFDGLFGFDCPKDAWREGNMWGNGVREVCDYCKHFGPLSNR